VARLAGLAAGRSSGTNLTTGMAEDERHVNAPMLGA
jgi:hypothetical protein